MNYYYNPSLDDRRRDLNGEKNYHQEIHNILHSGRPSSKASFEELYRHAAAMVIHRQGGVLYNQINDAFKKYLRETMLPNVINTNDHDFLLNLSSVCWPHYQDAALRIRDINMYLDRVYIQQQNHNVRTINDLAFQLFRVEIIHDPVVQNLLRSTAYKVIELARQNEDVEWSDLKSTYEMLLILGCGHRGFYQQHFEDWLLQKFTEHYRMTFQTIMAEENAAKLLQMMADFITKEKECIIAGHFDSITETKILDALNREIISGINIQNIVAREDSGLLYMLKNHRIEELKAFYNLLGHTQDGICCMVDPFFEYICEDSPTLPKFNSAVVSKKHVDIIENILLLQTETSQIIRYVLQEGNCELNDRIQAKFANLITPKLLSLCIGFLLREEWNSLKETGFIADILDKAVKIFKFIADKSAFEKCYQQHLGRRLLASQNNSLDEEKVMLERLKTECGSDFTRKMKEMLKDMEASYDLMNSYKMNVGVEKIEFSTQILTTNIWPISRIPPCILPSSAEAAFNHFQQFYISKYSKRTLTIHPGLGTADLKATFYKKQIDGSIQKESKTLVVSTFQMCILMRFNQAETFTFKQLLAKTNIPDEDLKRALAPMVMGKESQKLILTRIGKNETTIEDNDIFSINDEFTSKQNRIRIQASKMRKTETVLEKADEDRKHEIESAIVRVMKARRSLLHNELIAAVTQQLNSRFFPDPTTIKKTIEVLIDREFVKRDESNLNLYHYIC